MTTTIYRYQIYCETESAWKYVWNTEGNPPTTCPTNTAHTVDLNSVAKVETVQQDGSSNPNSTTSVAFYNPGFNRLSVADPYTIFDYKILGALDTQIWTQVLGTGGTVTYQDIDSTINITAPAGQTVINQTYKYHPYQPGKLLQILFSGALCVGTPVTNAIYRMGSFDSNVQKTTGLPDRGGDGNFIEYSAGDIFVVQRQTTNSAPYQTDTKIAKANWNIDPLDGTGPSGLNRTALQLAQTAELWCIFREWLGVGAVTLGVEFAGNIVPIHQFDNEGTSTYMKTAGLPVRYEVDNTSGGSSAVLKQICCSVVSLGGYKPVNSTKNYLVLNRSTSSNDEVFMAMQLKSTHCRYSVKIDSVSFTGSTLGNNEAVLITILLDPTLSNPVGTYNSVANSAVNVALAPGVTVSNLNTGTILYQTFVANSTLTKVADVIYNALTANINGTSRTLIVTVRTLPGSTVTSGNLLLTWNEIY